MYEVPINLYQANGARVKFYWSCGKPGHRHLTSAIAKKCIQKQKQIGKAHEEAEKLKKRNAEILQRYSKMKNYNVVGNEFGISRERVRQIVHKAGKAAQRNQHIRPVIQYADLMYLELYEITLDKQF